MGTAELRTSRDTFGTPDRAIVMLHGIGTQTRGSVLSSWVQALLDWFQQVPHDHNVVVRAQLDRIVVGSGSDPTWADIVVAAGPPDALDIIRVRIYEAYWADVIQAPSFRKLISWSSRVLPKIVAHHVTGLLTSRQRLSRADAASDSVAQQVRGVLRLVIAVLSTPLLLLLLTFGAALSLASIIAIFVLGLVSLLPFLQKPATALQGAIASTLGDTTYITTNDVQRAYVVHRAKRALDQAFDDVDGDGTVTLLAHSQGAAVAYYALTEGRPIRRPVDLLTFGQGLSKIERIRAPMATISVTLPYVLSVLTGLMLWRVIARDAIDHWSGGVVVVLLGLSPLLVIFLITVIGAMLWQIDGVQKLVRAGGRVLSSDGRTDVERLASTASPWLHRGLGWLVVGIVAAVSAWWGLLSRLSIDVDAFAVLLVTCIALALLFGRLQTGTTRGSPSPSDSPARDALTSTPREGTTRHALIWPAMVASWTDIYASADPVPNGPMQRPVGQRPRPFASREIVNSQSALFDHTGYWANAEQFVSVVAARLLPNGWEVSKDAVIAGDRRRASHGVFLWYVGLVVYLSFLAWVVLGPLLPIGGVISWLPTDLPERFLGWASMSTGRVETILAAAGLLTLVRLTCTGLSRLRMDRGWHPVIAKVADARPVDADAEAGRDLASVAVEEVPRPTRAPPSPAPEAPPAPAPPTHEREVVFYMGGTPVYSTKRSPQDTDGQ